MFRAVYNIEGVWIISRSPDENAMAAFGTLNKAREYIINPFTLLILRE
jgi:hypothetical protein